MTPEIQTHINKLYSYRITSMIVYALVAVVLFTGVILYTFYNR